MDREEFSEILRYDLRPLPERIDRLTTQTNNICGRINRLMENYKKRPASPHQNDNASWCSDDDYGPMPELEREPIPTTLPSMHNLQLNGPPCGGSFPVCTATSSATLTTATITTASASHPRTSNFAPNTHGGRQNPFGGVDYRIKREVESATHNEIINSNSSKETDQDDQVDTTITTNTDNDDEDLENTRRYLRSWLKSGSSSTPGSTRLEVGLVEHLQAGAKCVSWEDQQGPRVDNQQKHDPTKMDRNYTSPAGYREERFDDRIPSVSPGNYVQAEYAENEDDSRGACDNTAIGYEEQHARMMHGSSRSSAPLNRPAYYISGQKGGELPHKRERDYWPETIPRDQNSFASEMRAAPGFAQSTPASAAAQPASAPWSTSLHPVERNKVHTDHFPAEADERRVQDQQRGLQAYSEAHLHPAPSTFPVGDPTRAGSYQSPPAQINEMQPPNLPSTNFTPKERGAVANQLYGGREEEVQYSPWTGPSLNHEVFPRTASHMSKGPNERVATPRVENRDYEARWDHQSRQLPPCPPEDLAGSIYPNLAATQRQPQMFSPYQFPLHSSFPQAFLAPNLDHLKGPTFNGKTNFQDFIVQFDSIAQIKGWAYGTKGERLLMALEGQATSILPTLSPTLRTDYASLRAALEKRFNPQLDPDLAGNMAHSRRRKKGETYVAFAQELKRMMNATYENWPPDQVERLARERFFNSIDDLQLKGLLWSRSPRSVEEAAIMADGLEKLIEPVSSKPHNQAVYTNHQEQKSERKDSTEEKENGDRRQKGGGSGQQSRAYQPAGNNNPAGTGQPPRRPGAPRREQQLRPPRRGPSARWRTGNNVPPDQIQPPRRVDDPRENYRGGQNAPGPADICYYCQQPGHWAKFCFRNPHRIQATPPAGVAGSTGRFDNIPGSQSGN